MAPIDMTAKDVYDQLLADGASTVEAIGIMANMINESSFNPEAVGDQGTSFGVVQEHGAYSYLVTGNASADLAKQLQLLKSQGGFGDASGSTGAQAAGNFSASFERCVGCQPGGAQYNSRMANAATVEGWIQSGKWPTSAGSATGTTPATTDSFLGGIGSGIIGGILNSLGVPSLKDVFQRLGLILLGAVLVIVGIHILAGGSGGKTPLDINVQESESGGTRTRTVNRKVNAPGIKHQTTSTRKAAIGTGAKEAAEAAAVALRTRLRIRWLESQEQANR